MGCGYGVWGNFPIIRRTTNSSTCLSLSPPTTNFSWSLYRRLIVGRKEGRDILTHSLPDSSSSHSHLHIHLSLFNLPPVRYYDINIENRTKPKPKQKTTIPALFFLREGTWDKQRTRPSSLIISEKMYSVSLDTQSHTHTHIYTHAE